MSDKLSCLRCGNCCRSIVFKLNVRNVEDREFYRARGFKVDGTRVDARVDHVCPHLVGDDCDLHGSSKPSLCRKYPGYVSDGELLPGCGYKE